MFIQDLNLNELRIFAVVYRHSSMTLAARELYLTQSGVSQHIAQLEEHLQIKLFDRIKRQLYPTPAARELYEVCRRSFEELESALQNIRGDKDSLVGTLKIAMPQQFGANILAPLLGEFSALHPRLHFDLHFQYSQSIVSDLMDGKIDIGFIDEFYASKHLEHTSVYTEKLNLVVHKRLLPKSFKHTKKFYEALPYVDYEGNKPLVHKWFKKKLGSDRLKINIRANIPSTGGVATMIASGMGAGIIPDHVTQLINQEKELIVLTPPRSKVLTNTIHIAHLKGRTQSQAVAELDAWLRKKLQNRTS